MARNRITARQDEPGRIGGGGGGGGDDGDSGGDDGDGGGGGGGGGGGPLFDSSDISTSYEVVDNTLRVTVDLTAPDDYYSGAVSLSYNGTGPADNITVSTIPVTGGPDTAVLDLESAGVPEGERSEVFVTVAFDNGAQVQETVEVTWGAPALDVEVLDLSADSAEVTATVSVTTNTTQTIEYAASVVDEGVSSQPITEISGTLYGGSGSYPGDTETHEIVYSTGGATSGALTVSVTEPPAAGQDQESWSVDSGGGTGDPAPEVPDPSEIGIERCDIVAPAEVTPEDTVELEVEWLAPTNDNFEADVRIDVGGKFVGTATSTLGGLSFNRYELTDLPVGSNMDVTLSVVGTRA